MGLFGQGGISDWADPVTTAVGALATGKGKSGALAALDPGGFFQHGPNQAASAESALAAFAQKSAAPYLKAYKSGKLTAGQQAEVNYQKRSAEGQTAESFARSGMGQSSSLVQAQNQIEAEAKTETSNFLQQDLQKALELLGAGSGELLNSANIQLQQDAMMGDAMGNASSAIAGIFADSGSGGGG